uniref:ubiquitinyl hydrolase 1 n=1 Tax=Lepeophtheirus salmonis TaxID=72036 RepID=A0A0K2UC78_LEPSM
MPVGRIYEPPPRVISIKRGSFETEEFVKPSSKARSIPIKIKVDVNNNKNITVNKIITNGGLESTKSSRGKYNENIIQNGLDNKDEISTVISIPIRIIKDPSPTRATIKLPPPVSSSIQEKEPLSESISTSRPLNIPVIKKSVSPEPLENEKSSQEPEADSADTTCKEEISEKEICESVKNNNIVPNKKVDEEKDVEEDRETVELEEVYREDIVEDEVDENLARRLGFIKTDHAKGLRNLGNTCFMNSTIQCLAHSIQLLELIQKNYFTNSEENSDLTDSFADVIRDLWSLGGKNSTRATVDPVKFKGEIGKFAPKFSGYNQHDSQEFLQYLLEGIHNELNRVDPDTRKAESKRIAEQSKEEEKADSLLIPIEYGKKCLNNYLLRDNSFVTDLFMGQFRSTLKCLKCNNESVTFEPFWVVSLPIPPKSVQPKLEDCLRLFTKGKYHYFSNMIYVCF